MRSAMPGRAVRRCCRPAWRVPPRPRPCPRCACSPAPSRSTAPRICSRHCFTIRIATSRCPRSARSRASRTPAAIEALVESLDGRPCSSRTGGRRARHAGRVRSTSQRARGSAPRGRPALADRGARPGRRRAGDARRSRASWRSGPVEERIRAARSLGRGGDREAERFLLDAMSDAEWPVRAQAATALGALHLLSERGFAELHSARHVGARCARRRARRPRVVGAGQRGLGADRRGLRRAAAG